MDLSKTPMFLYQRRLYNKGHLNLTTEVPKKFSPDVFNRLRVTHNKSSDKGNLELTEEWPENIFFKVVYGKRSIFNFLR